jgi:hypothetical protein
MKGWHLMCLSEEAAKAQHTRPTCGPLQLDQEQASGRPAVAPVGRCAGALGALGPAAGPQQRPAAVGAAGGVVGSVGPAAGGSRRRPRAEPEGGPGEPPVDLTQDDD